MESIFKNKKVIFGIVIVLIAFFVYGAFFVVGKKDDPGGLAKQSVSSSGGSTNGVPELEDGPAKEFVTQLLAIQNITFKMGLFDDVVFKNMHVVDDTIQQQPIGRRNPFLPFEVVGGVITPSAQDLGAVSPSTQVTPDTAKIKVTPTSKPKKTR